MASWRKVLRGTVHRLTTHQVTDLAAALTFWAVLSAAPATLALVSLLGLFGDGGRIVDDVMATVAGAAPELDLRAVEPVVRNLASQQGAGLALVGGLALALWSASGYVNAFSRALNRVHEVSEDRPIWRLKPLLLLVTLVVLVLAAVICVALVLSGPVARAIGALIGLSEVTVAIWGIAKWPVLLALVALVIAVLYHFTPNLPRRRIRWVSVGSVVAIGVWAVATAGFGVYVVLFGSYRQTYGTLAGVVVLLLWAWLTNTALLLGAELDAERDGPREPLRQGGPSRVSRPPRQGAGAGSRALRR